MVAKVLVMRLRGDARTFSIHLVRILFLTLATKYEKSSMISVLIALEA